MLNEKVMRLARIRYVVTSHDPFDGLQAAGCLAPPQAPPRYRASLVIDRLLEGDSWEAVGACLRAAGEPRSLQGVHNLLARCVGALQPEFVSAATPSTFSYEPEGVAAALQPRELSSVAWPPSAQQVR